MVKFKHRGKRSKTRRKLRKKVRQRGHPNPNVYLKQFEVGQKVHIDIDPSVHDGMPHRRFDGRTGEIVGRRGECYLVLVPDMAAQKRIIVHPAHLKAQVM